MSDPVTDSYMELQLEALRELLSEHEFAGLEQSLAEVLNRMLVGRILTDETFLPVRELPSVYAAGIDDLIGRFVDAHGLNDLLDASLLRTVRKLIVRGQGQGARTAIVSEATIAELGQRLHRQGRSSLRCSLCGYHFQGGDMNARRRDLLKSFGLNLAATVHPAREADPVKRPIMTGLEIDHVIPRVGWGPSDLSNLQLLCQLCNQGKSIYVKGLEPISVIAAGSYGTYHGIDHAPNRTIFFSSLLYKSSTCESCGVGVHSSELTVVPQGAWFTPWSSRVVCYSCYGQV